MAPAAIERWHETAQARDPARLGTLLAEDVVFQSPVVHTPQGARRSRRSI
jgi:ketosteroid isomerase-like protein